MLKLTRKGRDVFYEGTKLTRVDQATKGPGNEVIKIEGLPGSNGAKWISLSKLKQGDNTVEVQGRQVTNSGSYSYTTEEKAELEKLQARINQIKTQAKLRYESQHPQKVDTTKMTPEQLEEYIIQLRKIHQEQLKVTK
jgi:hypothetical protein